MGIKIGDVIAIVLTISVSILISFFTLTKGYESNQLSFDVKISGEVVLDLAVDNDYKGIHAFRFKDQIAYVEIASGKVRLLEMAKEICPKQICSSLGWIEEQGEILVCLPNKLVVEIKENESEKRFEADAVSF